MKVHLQEIRRACRFLSRAEEVEAATAAQAGDRAARDRLILSALPLAVGIAARWKRRPLGIEVEDLVAEAELCVVVAVKYYDPSRARFATYVGNAVRHWLSVFIRRRHSLIVAIAARRDDEPGAEMRAKLNSVQLAALGRVCQWNDGVAIVDRDAMSPCDEACRREELDLLRRAMRVAHPDDLSVVLLRLEGQTHQAISERLGVSRERARQREARALKRITAALGMADVPLSITSACGWGHAIKRRPPQARA